MRVAELQNKVAEQIEGSPHGIQAIFIVINEKWALKVFRHEDSRDYAFDTQKKCLDKGWAPELGGKVNLPESGSRYSYGYVTEIVETLPNVSYGNRENYREKHGEEKYMEALQEVQNWKDENCLDYDGSNVQKWVEEIYEETSWYFGDCHVYNWGRKDGKWIPIDFG